MKKAGLHISPIVVVPDLKVWVFGSKFRNYEIQKKIQIQIPSVSVAKQLIKLLESVSAQQTNLKYQNILF